MVCIINNNLPQLAIHEEWKPDYICDYHIHHIPHEH